MPAGPVRRRAGRDFDKAAWQAFLDWACGYDDPAFEGRSLVAHEAWLDGLDQSVLRLDSAQTPEELRDAVLSWEPRQEPRGGFVAPARS